MFPPNLTQIVVQALVRRREIGRGSNAVVFDCDHPDHVVRVLNWNESLLSRLLDEADGNEMELRPLPDPFGGRNFGQAVGVLEAGASAQSSWPTILSPEVLRRQCGTPAGLTHTQFKGAGQHDCDAMYANALRSAANLSLAAYDQFARDLQYLNEIGAEFDPSKSNNVLIDAHGDRFNLVDLTSSRP